MRSRVVTQIEQERSDSIAAFATRYEIEPSLAAIVWDAALATGLDPAVAFQLVKVESSFDPNAVGSSGEVGLTQLMARTAWGLEPGITRDELLDPETNVRLGFAYLARLIEEHDGDVRLALLVFNRGPARVRRLVRAGRDPENGYAARVLEAAL